jgi:hypothetical protein
MKYASLLFWTHVVLCFDENGVERIAPAALAGEVLGANFGVFLQESFQGLV